jgi:hypothetical protein
MNRRSSSFPRLLHQLRGILTIAPTELNRRDLNFSSHSEVQLELDFEHTNKAKGHPSGKLIRLERMDCRL